MKKLYLLCFVFLLHVTAKTQTIDVSGQCMTGTITLNPLADLVNGKIAYQGTGTVDGLAGVAVSISWLGAPDNLWVLAYDGQPYFKNACNTALPLASPNVPCPWSAVDGTTCTGGTPLTIAGAGVLAVKMLSFTAANVNQQVILSWKTATETNNKTFIVQRSTDGNTWQNIGSVPGSIHSNTELQYHFTDKAPGAGKNYYRLLQIDVDGKGWYTSILTIEILLNRSFQVLNTAAPGKYQVIVESTEPAELSVYDISAKKIWSLKATKGMYNLDLTQYPAGIYMLQVRVKDKNLTQKIINP